MERRKFVIGAGALATGSAAAVGSGAFSSVEADRDVSVEVANDADAYLGLEGLDNANANQYVSSSGGTLEIDIAGSGNSGTGVNQDAVTEFNELFTVSNQGTQDVFFYIRYDPDDGQEEFLDGAPVDQEDPEGEQNLEFFRADDGFILNFPEGGSSNASGIGAGESIDVGLRVDTRGVDLDDDEPLFDGTVTLNAVGLE